MHAENLIPVILAVCRYAAINIDSLDVIAVSKGPGSYTGLRIGISTAKGLSMATDARLVGVPTLEAWAYGLAQGDRPHRPTVVLAATRARATEVYAAAFRHGNAGLQSVLPTIAEELNALPDIVRPLAGPDVDLAVVGFASSEVVAALGQAGVNATQAQSTLTAETIARLGARRAASGEFEDLVTFEPLYSKQFVAKRPKTSIFERLNV